MSDSTITAMTPASLPLSNEAVPCVQDGANVQAPAAAFGIPIASSTAPSPFAPFQTWIDTTASPPTVKMYIDSAWRSLYTIADDGTIALYQQLTLPGPPTSDYQAATKLYVDSKPVTPGTMVYKGVISCSSNPNYPAANQGDFYVVSSAGKIGGASGVGVEISDTLLCRVNGTASGTQGSVGANWTIGQGNIDSPVTSTSTSTDGDFVQFNGATGKLVHDTGLSFDTDATMAANSDSRIPSQKAVKSSIGGQPLSTDVLQQGQGWYWDAVSATFKARSNEGLNLLVNSAFEVWQENTSYTFGGSATKMFLTDYWKVGASSSPSFTATRVAGISGSQYAIKFQRTAGQTNTSRVRFAQQFGQAESMFLAGKTVTVSFDFVIGANYSPSGGPFVILFYGTGVDEDLDLHAGTPAFATGGGNVSANLSTQVAVAGTVARLIAPPLAIPTGVTELVFQINTAVAVGTAGADDSFTIADVKMEIGNIATQYRKPDYGDELRRCQRRYWKTFLQATVPAQNAGAATGEHRVAAMKAGAVAQTLGSLRFPTMRTTPTMTLFNPAAVNAQARDITASADCSATSAQNISDSGCEIVTTGNASTAVGNTLGVHVTADARL